MPLAVVAATAAADVAGHVEPAATAVVVAVSAGVEVLGRGHSGKRA